MLALLCGRASGAPMRAGATVRPALRRRPQLALAGPPPSVLSLAFSFPVPVPVPIPEGGAALPRRISFTEGGCIMAKIRFVSPVDEARGTIGGVVFSSNKSCSYAKSRRQPVQPYSVSQSFGKGIVSQWPNEWRSLDQSQRDDWDSWAADPAQVRTNALGIDYYLSGFQQFVGLNTRLYWFILAFQEDPPAVAKPTAPTVSTITIYKTGSASNSEIIFDEAEFTDENFLLDMAFFISGTPITATSQYRAIVREWKGVESALNLQTYIEIVFGDVLQGMRWIARLARVDDNGQISAYKETMGVVMP